VSQAIVQIEKVTQTTAVTAEETAAASVRLNGHAKTSMVVVGRLAMLVERVRAAVTPKPAAARTGAIRAAGGPAAAGRTAPAAPRTVTATRQVRSTRTRLRRAS
jgi:hypothetical protein